MTADGYAEMVAVNYLAPWFLTNLLRETLIRSAPSRVVTVASEASRQAAGFDPLAALIDKRPFSARGSSAIYSQTKLMNIMYSFANLTGGYFSVTDARALVPVAPGSDPKAQQALWQATAERVAAFTQDPLTHR
jgi:hypothetical protein